MSAPTWDDFAELALKCITSSGAEYGDSRIVHSTSQTIRSGDRRIASIRDHDDIGTFDRDTSRDTRHGVEDVGSSSRRVACIE